MKLSAFCCERLKPKIDKVFHEKLVFPFKLLITVTRKDNVIIERAAGKADTKIALTTVMCLGILCVKGADRCFSNEKGSSETGQSGIYSCHENVGDILKNRQVQSVTMLSDWVRLGPLRAGSWGLHSAELWLSSSGVHGALLLCLYNF